MCIRDSMELVELIKINNTPETHIKEIIHLTKIITDQNYFAHNNMFYTQTDGLPMGSPISGILAEIFIHTKVAAMDSHENLLPY